MYAKPPSEMRTTSLLYNNQHDPTYKSRPKSLSARSTTSHHRTHDKKTFRSSLPSQGARQSIHKQPTNPSLSSHPVFPPHPQPRTSERSSSLKQAPVPQSTLTPDTARALPTREALTKWQSEREEAKADIGVLQRARMKERVRRANEMEREKEKELQAVGLGAEKGARVLGVGLEVEKITSKRKRERGGCFAGFFGGRMRRWW
ncbi:hypothetical protein BDU57DRAFT_450510 [Ampelomyces quisqualis]|uniref:Uncharacterized protein n=1 Tax=Ampelomyces quisqualis TaxID=50730 RepID=A0A6A5QQ42_AMPQU|nr:hypothetical protein BDU57DRAFT_450510 [Ampelomyces quisqualis]